MHLLSLAIWNAVAVRGETEVGTFSVITDPVHRKLQSQNLPSTFGIAKINFHSRQITIINKIMQYYSFIRDFMLIKLAIINS